MAIKILNIEFSNSDLKNVDYIAINLDESQSKVVKAWSAKLPPRVCFCFIDLHDNDFEKLTIAHLLYDKNGVNFTHEFLEKKFAQLIKKNQEYKSG